MAEMREVQRWARGVVLAAFLAFSAFISAPFPGAAQTPAATPYFPETGFSIKNPDFLAYFNTRGGATSLGFPVSNEFQLLGAHVQIFQRFVLVLQLDGTVSLVNLLDEHVLPLQGANGSTFPASNGDLTALSPNPGAPEYFDQATAYLDSTLWDEWEGVPTNFFTTYSQTVSCSVFPPGETCDSNRQLARAMELWGLPTSYPDRDPNAPNMVYQRFTRGILYFNTDSGDSGWVLVGDWFKRVLIGTNLPLDLQEQMAGSPFLAEYAPDQPHAVARPTQLPDTSLVNAFTPDIPPPSTPSSD